MKPLAKPKSTLSLKVAALGAFAALSASIALVTTALWQSVQYERLAKREIDGLISTDLDRVTMAAYNLVKTEDKAVSQELEGALNVATKLFVDSGGREEFLRGDGTARLSAVVDQVTALLGATATIFRRVDETGDMLRIATTVHDTTGRVVVGTSIKAIDPDDGENQVVASVLRGNGFRGRAFVVDSWYIAAYEPIRDDSGRVAGMLFVGEPQAKAEALIREAILSTTIDRSGYVYVVSGKGENRGRYVVSQGGERDGEYIWDVRDQDGRYVTREIVEKALALGAGELASLRYRWQNPGEPEARWRMARVAYYAPWDWVIGTSVYEDEIESYRAILSTGRGRMAWVMALAGALVAILVAAASGVAAHGISGPLRSIATAAELVARGGSTARVETRSRDEVGALAQAFNLMSRRVEDTLAVLRSSEEKYRGIFESAGEGILRTTVDGVALDANPAMARMFGYDSPRDFLESVRDVRSSLYIDGSDRDGLLSEIREKGAAAGMELRFRRKDGSPMWVSINARVVPGEGGQSNIIGFVSDIDERKRAERALKDSLLEKDALLREIHHRVKNNLQVIASLLSMQSRTVSDPESLALYGDFSNRVLAMSQVHEQLYESRDFSRMDFGEYARTLAENLRQSYANCFGEVVVAVEAESVELELNQAVTCGLLLNEILSNSFRHAFPPDRRDGGRVSLRLATDAEGRIVLRASDDGIGIPERFRLGDTAYMGLALIPLLAAQLDASVALDRAGGTSYTIAFRRA